MQAYQTSKARSGRGNLKNTPAPPASVTSSLFDAVTVRTTWQDPADATVITSYKVYRSVDGGAFTLRTTIDAVNYPAFATFDDTPLGVGTYQYKVSCFGSSGESTLTTGNSIQVTSSTNPTDLDWNIPDSPYALPFYPVEGVGGFYDLIDFVDVPTGVTPAFVLSTPFTGISVDGTSGRLTVDATAIADSYSVQVNLADASTADAQADWLYRTQTGPYAAGVQWYHAFTSDAEVTKFKRVDPAATARWGAEVSDWCRRITTDTVGYGGTLELVTPRLAGTMVHQGVEWTRPFSKFPGDAKYIAGYDTVADLDYPACLSTISGTSNFDKYQGYRRGLYGQAAEWTTRKASYPANPSYTTEWQWVEQPTKAASDFYIQYWYKQSASGPEFDNATPLTVTSIQPYVWNGVYLSWMRPEAEGNPQQDGVLVTTSTPHGIPESVWTTAGGSNKSCFVYLRNADGLSNFNGRVRAIYGVPSANQVILAFTPSAHSQAQYDAYVSGSAQLLRVNPVEGKHCFIETCGGNYGELIPRIRKSLGTVSNAHTEADRTLTVYSGKEKTHELGTPQGVANPTPYPTWQWPKDEWVSILIHVIPGSNHPWPAGSYSSTAQWLAAAGPADNGFEMWVATASQIRAAGPGNATYTQVWGRKESSLGANDGLKLFFAAYREDQQGLGYGPVGFNTYHATQYMNDYKTHVEWSCKWAQIIFSHDPIPCPQVAP